MSHLRRNFERFCYQNRHKGIPSLMLYICMGSAAVYLFSMVTRNYFLYQLLAFNKAAILQGQVWRLFSYCITMNSSSVLLTFVMLLCYYSLGTAMENQWGTLKFNLFYLTGIILMDIYSMMFNTQASVLYLNMSLFLGYATMYPQAGFLLFFIIPVKAWVFALFDLIIILMGLTEIPFTAYNLFPLIALANYFLFFGKDVSNLFPVAWKANFRRLFRSKNHSAETKAKVIPFPTAGSYEATVSKPKAPYTHRCTVCGRTDLTDPQLEFRYCSRCNGYYCYCEDHINDHTHIQ